MATTDPPRFYWRKYTPRKPRPPEDSPRHKAYVARICEELKVSTAASNGLKACPRCKAEVGVHLARPPRSSRRDSGRLAHGMCEGCGLKGRTVYGMQDARDAWNDDGWREWVVKVAD
jgi:hypothetical protein